AAEAGRDRGGAAPLELRVVDGSVALQPADGADAPLESVTRLCVRVLQAGFPALQRASRSPRDRVREAAAVDLPAHLPQAHARLPDARPRVDAGAEPL